MKMNQVISLMLLVVFTGVGFAQEEAQLKMSSKVTGNQEQPNVMHILPWQNNDIGVKLGGFEDMPGETSSEGGLFQPLDAMEGQTDRNGRGGASVF